MASIKSFPNNSDTYIGAEDVMKWHYGRGKGVYGTGSNLAVQPLDTPAMAVNVTDGIAWMTDGGTNGIVAWNDTEDDTGSKLQLTIPTAHASYARIDRVVISWATPDYDTLPTITVLKGTASASPVAPSLTNTGALRQISLAKIAVAAGATSIVSADITDERLDSTVCGLVTDSVSVDTTVMQAQWTALVTNLGEELARVIAGGLPSHASTHASSGTDPITVGSTSGKLVETTINGKLTASRSIVVGNTAPASVTGLSEGDIYIYCPNL